MASWRRSIGTCTVILAVVAIGLPVRGEGSRPVEEEELAARRGHWVRILPKTVFGPLVSRDGWLWVAVTPRKLLRARLPLDADDPRWSEVRVPGDLEIVAHATLPGGDLLVATVDPETGDNDLWKVDGDRGAWHRLRSPLRRGIRKVKAGPNRQYWVIGHWRNVYRGDGERWVKQVPPVAMHVDDILPLLGGGAWFVGETRSLWAVFLWDGKGWSVRAKGREPGAAALWVQGKDLLARRGSEVLRFPFDGRRPPAPEEALQLPSGALFAGGRAYGSGWIVDDRVVTHREEGRERRIISTNCASIYRIVDSGLGQLFAGGTERDLLLFEEAVEVSSEDVGSPLRVDTSVDAQSARRIHALEVIRIDNGEWIYAVDAEAPNQLYELPLGSRRHSARTQGDNRAEAQRRGIGGGFGDDSKEYFTYDTLALSGDLNGDGAEDLVLLRMYEANLLFLARQGGSFRRWFDPAVAGRLLDDTVGGCLLDADGDGDLDLYVANLLRADQLLLNNGRATFEVAGADSGISTVDGSEMAACTDLDQDGDMDIVVATMGRGLLYHENLGGEGGQPRFRTSRFLTDQPPGPAAPLSSVDMSGLASADFDGDGSLEVYVGVLGGCDLLLRWTSGKLSVDRVTDEGPLCGDTWNATVVDPDEDGRLDLLALTDQGILLASGFSSEGSAGRLRRVEGNEVLGRPRTAISGDFNGDQVPDVFVQGRAGPTALLAGVGGAGARLVVRVIGPPWNRSAVGALVRIFAADGSGPLALRQIGGDGFSGRSSKDVHFGGLEAGGRYDIVVELPGSPPMTFRDLLAPGRVEVVLSTGVLPDRLRAELYRLETFTADRWNLRWLLAAIGLGLFVMIGALVLARVQPVGMSGGRFAGWIGASALGLSWLAHMLIPREPGWWALMATVGIGLTGAMLLLLWIVTKTGPSSLLSAQVELFEALSVFRHNETPRKVADRLRFLCTNFPGTQPGAVDLRRVALLRKDIDAYVSIVLVELSSIARLARVAGVPEESRGVGLGEIHRSLLRQCGKIKSRRENVGDADLRRLESYLAEVDRRLEAIESFAAARLRVRLRPLVEAWVASRAPRSTLRIDLDFEVESTTEVRATEEGLRRVLDILLENAERSIGEYGGPEEVLVRVTARDAEHVGIGFEDHGRGVPAEMKRRIFQPGVSGFSGGHGYGLDYARRGLGKFGARIEEVGRAGEGARFVVILKRLDAAENWSE